MDLGTGLALLGTAKLAEKLLGPTCDYLGEGFKNYTEKGVHNVNRIFTNAIKKLGNKIETEGSIPPKVLKGILQEGSFCDDELAAEYFGGVLASARSNVSRDDRAATFIALLSRLSSYQIRAHYIFYHMARNLFRGSSANPLHEGQRRAMEIYVPIKVFSTAMEYGPEEQPGAILDHVMFGLKKEGLIEDEFTIGMVGLMRRHFPGAKSHGFIFQPSAYGIQLFYWAYGKPDMRIQEFAMLDNEFEPLQEITILPGYESTTIRHTDSQQEEAVDISDISKD